MVAFTRAYASVMASFFVWGMGVGLLVAVCSYGACSFIRFVRSVPDDLG